YLRNLPIDYLKIDSAFIRKIATDPIDHAMVETIQRIAGIMGVRTVAEGVETPEVLDALSLIGVDFAQGNWVRRAVPLVQMHTVVGSREEGNRADPVDAPLLSVRSRPARWSRPRRGPRRPSCVRRTSAHAAGGRPCGASPSRRGRSACCAPTARSACGRSRGILPA